MRIITLDPQTFEVDLQGSSLSSVHAEAVCQALRDDVFNVVLASHYTDHSSTRISLHVTRQGLDIAAVLAQAAEAVCRVVSSQRIHASIGV